MPSARDLWVRFPPEYSSVSDRVDSRKALRTDPHVIEYDAANVSASAVRSPLRTT